MIIICGTNIFPNWFLHPSAVAFCFGVYQAKFWRDNVLRQEWPPFDHSGVRRFFLERHPVFQLSIAGANGLYRKDQSCR
jgi:hypothetical protein